MAGNLNAQSIINATIDVALATGLFDVVNGHEPKSPPGSGLTAAVWVQRILPADGASGLGDTAALLLLNLRIYTSMRGANDDAIDPAVTDATDQLMTGFNAAFTFGGLVRNIDVFGEFGTKLDGQAGYITIGTAVYRCMTITVPCVINDVWPQAA